MLEIPRPGRLTTAPKFKTNLGYHVSIKIGISNNDSNTDNKTKNGHTGKKNKKNNDNK